MQWLIDQGASEINFNKSLRDRARWSYITGENERHYHGSITTLLEEIQPSLEVECVLKYCRPVGLHMVKVAYLEEGDELPVEKVEEVISIEVVEEVPEEEVVPMDEQLTQTVDKESIDWEWIESLENNKQGKKDLAFYADKHFGIELKKNAKLENMIKRFKFALEEQS